MATLEQEFEILKAEAQLNNLLQTDVLYRRSDGKPSMKKRVKYIDGELTEVTEDKPIKSVHFIHFGENMVLRVRRSKKERKENLKAILDLAIELHLDEALLVLCKVSGVERGKNVDWKLNSVSPTFESIPAYLEKMKEDAKKAPAYSTDEQDEFSLDRPAISDDLLLIAGWQ